MRGIQTTEVLSVTQPRNSAGRFLAGGSSPVASGETLAGSGATLEAGGASLFKRGAALPTSRAPLGKSVTPLSAGGAPLGVGDAPLFTNAAPLPAGDAPLFKSVAPLGAGDAPLFTGDAPQIAENHRFPAKTPGFGHAPPDLNPFMHENCKMERRLAMERPESSLGQPLLPAGAGRPRLRAPFAAKP